MILVICGSIVNLVSIMTPKFLTCSLGVIAVDPTFKSGSFGIVRYFEPITSISVLSSFSFSIFAAYHARISSMAICMLDTASIISILPRIICRNLIWQGSICSGSAGASVVAHGVALPLYRDCFLDLRLFNSPDLRRLVLCYCCQAWTLETVLGGNTALTRWWTARSIDADAKR